MKISDIKNYIYSGNNAIGVTNIRYLPRWIVLLMDVGLISLSLFLSYLIISQFSNIEPPQTISWLTKYCLIIGVNMVFMFVFRTYSGIIRHSSFLDLFKILLSTFCSVFVLVSINVLSKFFFNDKFFLTLLLLIFFFISFTVLFLFRLVVKEVFHFAREYQRSSSKKNVLVLGIDEESVSIANAIMGNASLPYEVVGFITRRTDSKRAKLLGKRIYSFDFISKNNKDYLDIDGVVIASNRFTREELNEWVTMFLEKGLKVLKTPTLQKLRNNNEQFSIKNLQIEDLLNRRPIELDNSEVKIRHHNKSVLVTGGAGSIGSEIIRQVAQFKPSKVVVLDQAESPLYEIELELKSHFPEVDFEFVLADITNKQRMNELFDEYRFSMVYHAAAYKHVPLVEHNPQEGIRVNIKGTKNLAMLSSQYKVNRFVMVSTDKAVNPTNVMGATKRAAELFVQALQTTPENSTKFITTRFGNVLGSNGSVIPHFKKQIEKGGPVTITHPEIVRYFMTIPEACELVLQAGTMGTGGEIFVFDMGEPVKILNLARRMIKLSGFEPDEDIKIVYTGLRPGEKLYEELLSDNTKTLPTHHEKIMISKDEVVSYETINAATEEIIELAKTANKMHMVSALKNIVKEFKSNNSIYERLDV
ncbi:polysaccharide biosynthesis protein [Riemerella columbina]|uniref:polysaccharide biosynthesis protein n=1 Tax=Riemerella columbina TaxID=103810 RepID=UPI000364B4CC|nr:nucleoside-diphosphate sugar epimerase/dehydratase [Riemerella columbina]